MARTFTARSEAVNPMGEEDSASVVANVPEPGTLGLLGTGLVGLAGIGRRKLKT